MAGYRVPGPAGMANNAAVDAGTLGRTATSRPGPAGTQGGAGAALNERPMVKSDARLDQIRALVQANNRSSLAEDLIICQIYMESRFDANARSSSSSAKGLMQVLVIAVKQVFQSRKEKELGHKIQDRKTLDACFAAGKALHASPAILDEVVNIQIGTEYMQCCLDQTSSVEGAYKLYRGVSNGMYYNKIKSAAAKLKTNPGDMNILLDMVK
ncbi:MAG: transglycosylase SLT domain-containing protein [Pseudomonas sp.]|uniref:transglycosylase SLT domain-containing protein n=1 Tax=Pseudomonas sp. TaxID=306 RepID=UPI003392F935